MRGVSFDLFFVFGKGLDDLNELLESNVRFVFKIHRRKRGKDGWAVWRHSKHRGDVKLTKQGGTFRGRITDRSEGLLTGAFLSWIIRNAGDLIHGIDIRMR